MKVLILGAGRRGLRLARHLIEEKAEVTILDSSESKCQQAQMKLDLMAVPGSATDLSSLIEAGAGNADAVIAVTNSDEVNIISCGIVATNFKNVQNTIAVTRSISYVGPSHNAILGINHVVNPDEACADRIANIIRSGIYNDTITFPDTDFTLFTLDVQEHSPFVGQNLITLRKKFPYNFVVDGIHRDGELIIPSGLTTIQRGDTIAITSDSDEAIEKLIQYTESDVQHKTKRIIIIGASSIANFLLSKFTKRERRKVTLIDMSAETCEDFSRRFPEVLVINQTITDEEVWEEEEIHNADLVMSLTDNDELNIITASYSKKIGVTRSIALIKTNLNYSKFALSLGVDVALSQTDVTVDSIIKNMRGEGVNAMHSLFDGDLEVYEYIIQKDCAYIGKMLKEINLKGKVVVAGVKSSDGKSFVPGGDYVISVDDRLILAVDHDGGNQFIKDFFGL